MFPVQIPLETWLALETQYCYEAPDDLHAKNVKGRVWVGEAATSVVQSWLQGC